jgi:hypothetical protein
MILLAKAPSLKNGHAATTTSARPRGTLHLFSLTRASDSLRDWHLGLRHPLQEASFRSISHSISHSDNRAKIENLDSRTCASHSGLGPRPFDYLDRGEPVAFGDPSADPGRRTFGTQMCGSATRPNVNAPSTGRSLRHRRLRTPKAISLYPGTTDVHLRTVRYTPPSQSTFVIANEDTRCSAARCARAPLSFSQLTA